MAGGVPERELDVFAVDEDIVDVVFEDGWFAVVVLIDCFLYVCFYNLRLVGSVGSRCRLWKQRVKEWWIVLYCGEVSAQCQLSFTDARREKRIPSCKHV